MSPCPTFLEESRSGVAIPRGVGHKDYFSLGRGESRFTGILIVIERARNDADMKPENERRISLMLPKSLITWIDREAKARGVSRSKIVFCALEETRKREVNELAKEGYRSYLREAREFAVASESAVSEAWAQAGEWKSNA